MTEAATHVSVRTAKTSADRPATPDVQRVLTLPKGVAADRIEASFKKGVLMVVLPKTADALKQEKKIAVKAV